MIFKKKSYLSEKIENREKRKSVRLIQSKGKNIGKHFFNDGFKTIMAKECPEGFVPGRLKK